jgi:hypothetical protein
MNFYKELYVDFGCAFPETPWLIKFLFVTYAWITIPMLVWWDCDLRIFRTQVKIAVRRIVFRILGGVG